MAGVQDEAKHAMSAMSRLKSCEVEMPNKALVLVAAAVLEAREKPSTYSSRRPPSPRDHNHNGLAPGPARGQLLEAVEDLRNHRGSPGVGHAAGVEDLGGERGHPRIRLAAGAQDLGDDRGDAILVDKI
jgi:hypothetical protein